jgi:hypothetical protein
MTRLIVTLGLVLGLSSSAVADDDDRSDYKAAGRKGTVTAYEMDGTTVIAHRFCASRGRISWKYVECGTRLRERLKVKLCTKLGKGLHKYMYQVGDSRPSRSSVYCRRD